MEFLGQNEFVIWRNRLRNIRNKLPSSYHIPCLFIDQPTFLSPCGQPILNNLNHPLKLHVSHSSFQLHSHFAYVIVCTVNDQFTQPSYMKNEFIMRKRIMYCYVLSTFSPHIIQQHSIPNLLFDCVIVKPTNRIPDIISTPLQRQCQLCGRKFN